jgi:mono/diheme cytochrome c family protein
LTAEDLRRNKILCVIMIWLIAIFIPLYWYHEPARQKVAIARIERESRTRGAQIFVSHCTACHRKTGDGVPGRNLRRTALDEAVLVRTISRGRLRTAMPAFGDQEGGSLKKFEIMDVINFIRNWDQSLLAPAAAASKPTPFAQAAGGDAENGKVVFRSGGCAACHGSEAQYAVEPSLG